jgi:hypothetical protein
MAKAEVAESKYTRAKREEFSMGAEKRCSNSTQR